MDTPLLLTGDKQSVQSPAFGKVERQIARRYLGAKKSEGGVAAIAIISFICIWLAITAMITIMSIMNGFREQLIALTIGSQGHMYVVSSNPQPTEQGIKELEARLAQVPGVAKAFEFSNDYSGIQANGQLTLGNVIGISPDNLRSFDLIATNIQLGSLDGFGQGRGAEHQIAMGTHLATSLSLTVGDRVRILSPRTRQSPVTGPQPIIKAYTVGAIFEVGLYEADMTNIYMDLEQASRLFKGGERSGEIQIRLDDPDQIDRLRRPVREAAGEPIWVQTWRDKNGTIATALRTEQVAMRMIFVIVVIISTFPILAAMIMLVKNKAKDIAILRTIGSSRASILRIFFIAGSTVGLVGTIVGLLTGVLICLNIDVVQSVIESITGTELFPPDVYMMSTGIPAKVVWTEVLGVALCGFLISAVATFFPALSASRVDPVDALRYE